MSLFVQQIAWLISMIFICGAIYNFLFVRKGVKIGRTLWAISLFFLVVSLVFNFL